MATAIANRYARALADVVSRAGDFRLAQAELSTFAEVYRESSELREVLRTPAVPLADKTRILGAILARLSTSPTISNFLRVLLANYRMDIVDDVLQAFEKLVSSRLGIARVQISSAVQLSPADQQVLVARFEAVTGKKVEAAFQTAPGLLGGITAQIESTVYDGSVRGHLERIRERLSER